MTTVSKKKSSIEVSLAVVLICLAAIVVIVAIAWQIGESVDRDDYITTTSVVIDLPEGE